MRDNELFALLIGIIEAAEPGAGIPNVSGRAGVPVYQSYQPTQQGIATGPSAYLHIISHHRYGLVERSDIWDELNSKEIHTETQIYETMFQLSALSTQNPRDVAQYTAGDIVNAMAYIMQSESTLQLLRAAGVGIERVSDIRNPYFTDDRDRFEASPSFDFILTHKQIVSSEIPVLQSIELQILPV